MPSFDPNRCDLCGESAVETVLEHAGRVLTSDSRVVDGELLKVRCTRCGLVRNGRGVAAPDLNAHYRAYRLAPQAATAEPLFFTPEGLQPRSAVVAGWIRTSLERAGVPPPAGVLEIGCGEGSLLVQLGSSWPEAHLGGLDLSPDAVSLAAGRGLDARVGGYEDVWGTWPVIASFAVLEHVPSPSDFLRRAGGALAPRGVLVVAQPSQDQGSSDIFFADHLHHFRSEHVAALGAKAGLKELHRELAHPLIPNFSLHVFVVAPGDLRIPDSLSAAPLRGAIATWEATFDRLDAWLAARRGALAVWGLGQTFDLLRAYTSLGTHEIRLGIDDNPARFSGLHSFPVRTLDTLGELPPELDVLLTFVPSAAVRERLAKRDLSFFAPLAGAATPGGT